MVLGLVVTLVVSVLQRPLALLLQLLLPAAGGSMKLPDSDFLSSLFSVPSSLGLKLLSLSGWEMA